MCKCECFHEERKVLSADFIESEDAESFERSCQVCLQAISGKENTKLTVNNANLAVTPLEQRPEKNFRL